jgi:ABC-type Na+ efflux pump permease subunit
MEITLIALGLLLIGSLFYFGIKLNKYSEAQYNYSPINIWTILVMAVPFVLLLFGFLLVQSPENQVLSILFGLATTIGMFIYIQKKSDTQVALGAIVILLFAGLAITLLLSSSSRRDDDDY